MIPLTQVVIDVVNDKNIYGEIEGIHYAELPGDHNLSGRDRIGLLNYVNEIF